MRPVRTALIGLGFSGQTFHLPFLKTLPEFEVSAVLTQREELAQALAPEAAHCRTMTELLQQDIELVVITAPNVEHYPLARQALEAGVHVLVEKPFTPESVQAKTLCELAAQRNLVLSVYHNRRWDGDFLTIKSLLESGRLGDLYHFESHFDRFRPQVRDRWREKPGAGSGSLYDLGSHLIDQALCLFGPPQAVTAQALRQRPGSEAVDYFHVVLDYAPLQVILHGSALTALPGPRFQLHGDRASYIKHGLDPQEDALRDGRAPDSPNWGLEPEDCHGVVTDAEGSQSQATQAGDYKLFYRQLAAAIRGEADNPVPPEQAMQVIRIIELAQQSSDEGRRIAFTK
ncbi:oxidoreductase [Hahella aquimaris]|uniref:oxidoreductase n=1 Tax=Hahella sp. HNIBRBA332 TaxID=3015983 RepID=UPI00273AD6C6|nr:oxidoreductase [Hahella sp. HNIBRBA332]WLQ14970.1 oxidoreductase [Hahella sp. HNIBRBA332]